MVRFRKVLMFLMEHKFCCSQLVTSGVQVQLDKPFSPLPLLIDISLRLQPGFRIIVQKVKD
uniref:Uncharacterized protein n=1 Tax=Arundo donax TaxID=35708 RepID=A0A0A9EW09_ARUDO